MLYAKVFLMKHKPFYEAPVAENHVLTIKIFYWV